MKEKFKRIIRVTVATLFMLVATNAIPNTMVLAASANANEAQSAKQEKAKDPKGPQETNEPGKPDKAFESQTPPAAATTMEPAKPPEGTNTPNDEKDVKHPVNNQLKNENSTEPVNNTPQTTAPQAVAQQPIQEAARTGGPKGNNGTVKIDDKEFDSAPNNEPHVGCTFQVDFYGYDKGNLYADVKFALQPPTGRDTLLTDTVFIGEDDNSGGSSTAGLDASRTYNLTTYLAKYTPHPKQGYHVKLTVNADGSQGADKKHKVFWVQGCSTHNTPQAPTLSLTAKACDNNNPAIASGKIEATITNSNTSAFKYDVYVDGNRERTIRVSANSSKTFTIKGVDAGDHEVALTYKGESTTLAAKTITVDECDKASVAAAPSLVVTATACSASDIPSGVVTVRLTSNAPGSRTYTVTLGNYAPQTTTKLNQGQSQTLTFNAIAAGTYTVTAQNKSQKLSATSTVTVSACEETIGGRGGDEDTTGTVLGAAKTTGEVLGVSTANPVSAPQELANTGDVHWVIAALGMLAAMLALGLGVASRKQYVS